MSGQFVKNPRRKRRVHLRLVICNGVGASILARIIMARDLGPHHGLMAFGIDAR